jgi:hypothetical protein
MTRGEVLRAAHTALAVIITLAAGLGICMLLAMVKFWNV